MSWLLLFGVRIRLTIRLPFRFTAPRASAVPWPFDHTRGRHLVGRPTSAPALCRNDRKASPALMLFIRRAIIPLIFACRPSLLFQIAAFVLLLSSCAGQSAVQPSAAFFTPWKAPRGRALPHAPLLEPRFHVGLTPATDSFADLVIRRQLLAHPPERHGANAKQLRLLLQAKETECDRCCSRTRRKTLQDKPCGAPQVTLWDKCKVLPVDLRLLAPPEWRRPLAGL